MVSDHWSPIKILDVVFQRLYDILTYFYNTISKFVKGLEKCQLSLCIFGQIL